MATKKKADEGGDVVELFQSPADGQFYWRRKDPDNHRILSVGGEGFTKKDHVEQSAERSNSDVPRDRWVWIGVQEEELPEGPAWEGHEQVGNPPE